MQATEVAVPQRYRRRGGHRRRSRRRCRRRHGDSGRGELPDESGEGLRVDPAVAQGDEEGQGVPIEAGLEHVGHLERQIQRLLRVPRRLRLLLHLPAPQPLPVPPQISSCPI